MTVYEDFIQSFPNSKKREAVQRFIPPHPEKFRKGYFVVKWDGGASLILTEPRTSHTLGRRSLFFKNENGK